MPTAMQLETATDFGQLAQEHVALIRDYASVQARCSDELHSQARRIERLDAQAIRLRAAVIVRDTALAWGSRRARGAGSGHSGPAEAPDAGRRVDALMARIQDLMRLDGERASRRVAAAHALAMATHDEGPEGPEGLEASLRAADLVICQTGCLSHGDYWRLQDHCKRTGKACVLVEEPDALRIVRIHGGPEGQGRPRFATLGTERGS